MVPVLVLSERRDLYLPDFRSPGVIEGLFGSDLLSVGSPFS